MVLADHAELNLVSLLSLKQTS